jgi:outer membrane beta-barrel protein
MMKRWLIVLGLAAGVFAADLSSAKAQEVQITGPLAGAPAIRKMRMYRVNRIQLQPFVGFTMQDEFVRTMVFGAQANYHFTDWLGLGVWGGFGGVNFDTGLTDQISARGVTTDRNALSLPSNDFFSSQVGEITWMAALQGTLAPLRGKVSLFQKLSIDTDFYIHLGVAFVGVEERADVNTEGEDLCQSAPAPNATPASDPCVATQTARASRVAIAPSFGVGLSFYANDFMALTIEWRGLPFKWNTSGTDEAGGGPGGDFPDGVIDENDQVFHFNQMVSLGLAIYLPTAANISE